MLMNLAEGYWHTVLALVSLDFHKVLPTRRNPLLSQNIKDALLWLNGVLRTGVATTVLYTLYCGSAPEDTAQVSLSRQR